MGTEELPNPIFLNEPRPTKVIFRAASRTGKGPQKEEAGSADVHGTTTLL